MEKRCNDSSWNSKWIAGSAATPHYQCFATPQYQTVRIRIKCKGRVRSSEKNDSKDNSPFCNNKPIKILLLVEKKVRTDCSVEVVKMRRVISDFNCV